MVFTINLSITALFSRNICGISVRFLFGNEKDIEGIFSETKRMRFRSLRRDRFNRPIYKDHFTFARIRLAAFVASSELFFFISSFSRARLRVANAGQFPRCRRGRHRTALPRSVIAPSAALFFVFLFSRRAVRARGSRGGWARILPGIIEKSRVSRCGCGDPGPTVIGSRYFRSMTRTLEGHNPRA